jgi:hypothetical protein
MPAFAGMTEFRTFYEFVYIERSMFDGYSFHCSGRAKFHISAAASVQSDQKRNWVVWYRLILDCGSGLPHLSWSMI